MLKMVVITVVVFLLVTAAMAVGVMFGRKPISGSCGGLAQVGIDGECKICGRSGDELCSTEDASSQAPSGQPSPAAIAYDAMSAKK